MAIAAYVCRVTRENQGAITSEHPRFSLAEFEEWLEAHGEDGYFLRDENSQFDCRYFSELVLLEMYQFENGNESAMFRQVIKI